MLITCPNCGNKMYKVGPHNYECDCGNWAYYKGKELVFQSEADDPDDPSEYEYEDVYDMPSGCAACGNDAYPRCKDSCPLFDD